MAIITYTRVSTTDQKTDSQQESFAGYKIDKSFSDEGVSGVVKALDRKGFKACFDYLREGDTLLVSAVDRLGRSTIDVLDTVEKLQEKGVSIVSKREGFDLSTPIGKAMLAMMTALSALERENIKERQKSGIAAKRAKGERCGKAPKHNAEDVIKWREENKASLNDTAKHFEISKATVCKYLQKVA